VGLDLLAFLLEGVPVTKPVLVAYPGMCRMGGDQYLDGIHFLAIVLV